MDCESQQAGWDVNERAGSEADCTTVEVMCNGRCCSRKMSDVGRQASDRRGKDREQPAEGRSN